jgi:hypothetical protein
MAELPGLVVELALVGGAGRRLVEGVAVFACLGGQRIFRLGSGNVILIGLAERRDRAKSDSRDQRGRKQQAVH